MSDATVRYVTLAWGEADAVYGQATMLVLSLLAYAPTPREIVVLTDHPERFEWVRELVRVDTVTASQWRAWSGPAPFSMRQKLEAAAAMLPGSGALALIDADVVVVRPLDTFAAALAAGTRFMHKREFELGSNRRRGNRRLWHELRGRTFGAWRFRSDDAMWNSGVLAVPAADAHLIRDALALYDAMDAAGVRHFATEQLVAGAILGRAGRLAEAREWFTHYWGNKAAFTREIEARLDSARSRQLTPAETAAELRANPIALADEVRLRKWEKLRRWLRAGS